MQVDDDLKFLKDIHIINQMNNVDHFLYQTIRDLLDLLQWNYETMLMKMKRILRKQILEIYSRELNIDVIKKIIQNWFT